MAGEDLECWQGTEEEIPEAQRKVLEAGNFCLNKAEQAGNNSAISLVLFREILYTIGNRSSFPAYPGE